MSQSLKKFVFNSFTVLKPMMVGLNYFSTVKAIPSFYFPDGFPILKIVCS